MTNWIACCGGNGGGGTASPCVVATGEQTIDLPIYGDETDLVIKFKLFRYENSQGNTAIFGSVWNNAHFLLSTEGGGFTYYLGGGYVQFPVNKGEVMDIELGYDYAKVNGTLIQGGGSTRAHSLISIFSNNSGGNNAFCIMGGVQIFVDGDAVMNLVPMQDSQTGEGYYHDTIGNQDYYSTSGTGLKYTEMEGI